jgi:hypothetical protein
VPGVEEQQDVGAESSARVGGTPVVVEQRLAFGSGEVETGHKSALPTQDGNES